MSFVAGAITASLELVHIGYDQAILKAIEEAKQFKSETDDLSAHLDTSGEKADSSGRSVHGLGQQLVKAGGDTEGLAGAFEKLGASEEGAAAAAEALGPVLIAVGAAIAVVAYSVTELIKGTKDLIEEVIPLEAHIEELATNAGVATQDFSRFAFAAGLVGTNADEAAESFKFLGKNVYDATQGNENAIETFNKFSVAFEDSSGKARPLYDVMLDISDVIHNAAPGAERTGAAMELISARSTGMISTLSQGSAALRQQMGLADEFGVTVSDSTGEAAHGFEVLLHEVEAAWTGIKMMLGNELAIALQPELEKLVDWIKTHSDEIHAIVQGIASAVVSAVKLIIAVIEEVVSIIDTKLGRSIAGAVAGFALFGPVGAYGGLQAGAASEDISKKPVSVNVHPINADASFGQIATALQKGLAAQRRQQRQDQDLAERRMAIESGL